MVAHYDKNAHQTFPIPLHAPLYTRLISTGAILASLNSLTALIALNKVISCDTSLEDKMTLL
jgi:hypothetical protein